MPDVRTRCEFKHVLTERLIAHSLVEVDGHPVVIDMVTDRELADAGLERMHRPVDHVAACSKPVTAKTTRSRVVLPLGSHPHSVVIIPAEMSTAIIEEMLRYKQARKAKHMYVLSAHGHLITNLPGTRERLQWFLSVFWRAACLKAEHCDLENNLG